MSKVTLGVIVGNRDFFPDRLIEEGRRDMLSVLQEANVDVVILDERATKLGAVETWADAKACADLFKKHADQLDGILVTLPNFGDEKGIAETIKLSGLDLPILVQAYPDDLNAMDINHRRDSFCGKISVCNNLKQYGFPCSLTSLHTVHPSDERFKADLYRFMGVCRVVKGIRHARIGAIGARPNAFNTVRYSEKLLQESGISVQTADLSEILGKVQRLPDSDERVQAKLQEIMDYTNAGTLPQAPLVSMAKLGVVITEWMTEYDLSATALQCWTSLQENFGVNACTIMSLMSQKLLPSACEVDVTGAVSMYALQLASGTPSALVDWNNNYGNDPDKCVLFHCGNWAKSLLPDMKMESAHILGKIFGEDRTVGAVTGRTPAGPVTYARISTDDPDGIIKTYVGEGRFVDDPIDTFGSIAVVEIQDMPFLMQYICRHGFEHHVAMNGSQSGEILAEAFENYLGWELYYHASSGGCGGDCSCDHHED